MALWLLAGNEIASETKVPMKKYDSWIREGRSNH